LDKATNGVSFGQDSHTDPDFANDVCLLAEFLELLIGLPVLETMASKATSLEFEVNWQKTKVQVLGTRVNVPPTITVQLQHVAVIDQFVYLGSLIHSSTQNTPNIIRSTAACDGQTPRHNAGAVWMTLSSSHGLFLDTFSVIRT